MHALTEPHEDRWLAAWEQRVQDPAGALAHLPDLQAEAERSGDATARGRVLLLAGSCHWRRSDYASAMRDLTAALELLPTTARRERAAALLDLGTVRNTFGQHDEALQHALASLRIRDELDDDRGRGDVHNNLGIIFWNRGDLDEAIRSYRESAAIRARIGDRDGMAACRNNLAKVFTEQARYEEALTELHGALALWEQLDNLRGQGVAHNNIGVVHHRRGELAAAEARFRRSLALKEVAGDRHGSCETRTHLGRVVAARGAVVEAITLLEEAASDAAALGILAERAAACLALSEVNEAFGDTTQALVWYRRYHDADRALFDDRSTARLQGLQLAYQLQRAERESLTDPLTGLGNRRAVDRRLEQELQRIQRHGGELSVALLDLDAFKAINDTFGHATGDEVLRAVAQLLVEHTRASDLPVRYGGEEFAVLFPDTGLEAAAAAAEQLCGRVREVRWAELHPDLRVTVSIGVASTARTRDPAALFAAADRHLYLAKHSGKDRVSA